MSPSRTAKANFSLDFSLEDSSSGDGNRLEIAEHSPVQEGSNDASIDYIFDTLEKMESSPAQPQKKKVSSKSSTPQQNSNGSQKKSNRSTENDTITPQIEQLKGHPCFLDTTNIEEASNKLKTAGSFYLLPDENALNQAILLWKVCNEIFQHVTIKEELKESNSYLLVQGTKYNNIDEVLEKYLDPLISYAREIQAFKYYLDFGSLRKVAERLLKQKKKEPSKIHYVISPSSKHPGRFVISFLPKAECKHEFICPSPEGLHYRHKVFPTLKKLLAYHKEDPLGVKTHSQVKGKKQTAPSTKKNHNHQATPTQHHKKNKIHVELVTLKPEKKRKESVEEAPKSLTQKVATTSYGTETTQPPLFNSTPPLPAFPPSNTLPIPNSNAFPHHNLLPLLNALSVPSFNSFPIPPSTIPVPYTNVLPATSPFPSMPPPPPNNNSEAATTPRPAKRRKKTRWDNPVDAFPSQQQEPSNHNPPVPFPPPPFNPSIPPPTWTAN